MLSEYLKGGLSISELSRKHQVSTHTIYVAVRQIPPVLPREIYKWRNAMKKQQENLYLIPLKMNRNHPFKLS